MTNNEIEMKFYVLCLSLAVIVACASMGAVVYIDYILATGACYTRPSDVPMFNTTTDKEGNTIIDGD